MDIVRYIYNNNIVKSDKSEELTYYRNCFVGAVIGAINYSIPNFNSLDIVSRPHGVIFINYKYYDNNMKLKDGRIITTIADVLKYKQTGNCSTHESIKPILLPLYTLIYLLSKDDTYDIERISFYHNIVDVYLETGRGIS